MSHVLTESSDVECGHLGTVDVTGTSKLTVLGSQALLSSGVAGKSIALCITPNAPTATPPTKACMTVVSVLPVSLATKLTVGGQPVVLDTLKGLTDGLPPGSLVAVALQSKLTAV
jgi:hypothetical protein